jgi:diacylglycerol kinase (ATP)
LERIYRAAINTWNGLVAAARSEQAFREEIVMLVVSVPLAFVVTGGGVHALILIAMVLIVMVVELLNTAIEKLSDFISPGHHEAIGRIKDMGSAAVGLAILAALLVWLEAIATRFGII